MQRIDRQWNQTVLELPLQFDVVGNQSGRVMPEFLRDLMAYLTDFVNDRITSFRCHRSLQAIPTASQSLEQKAPKAY